MTFIKDKSAIMFDPELVKKMFSLYEQGYLQEIQQRFHD
jgi:hypothetical protein